VASQAEKFASEAASQNGPAPAASAAPARNWRRLAKRSLLFLAAGYLLLCAGLFFWQKKIIYRPAVAANMEVANWGFAANQARDISFQSSDGLELHGWLVSPGGPKLAGLKNAPLVDLFFGAQNGHRGERVNTLKRLAGRGAWTICFDYRGFGDNAGTPSEEALARDARAAWDTLMEKGVPPARVVLHGEALGAALAVRLAAELCNQNTPPGGLVLEGAFPLLPDVLARMWPVFPMRWLAREHYDSRNHIKSVTCPLVMISGAKDVYAPVSAARTVFDAAPDTAKSGAPKQFVELPNCANAEIGGVDTEAYLAAVEALFHRINAPAAAPPAEHSGQSKKKPRTKPGDAVPPGVPPKATGK
jgi:pimeloyl-ACP methyl ester carboxylesterase